MFWLLSPWFQRIQVTDMTTQLTSCADPTRPVSQVITTCAEDLFKDSSVCARFLGGKGSVRELAVAQQADRQNHSDRPVGDTVPVALREEFGCLSIARHLGESSASTEEEGVTLRGDILARRSRRERSELTAEKTEVKIKALTIAGRTGTAMRIMAMV